MLARTRIQLCGRITIELRGQRLEAGLPRGQGRLLFVYLVLNRMRPLDRGDVVTAIWPEETPAAAGGEPPRAGLPAASRPRRGCPRGSRQPEAGPAPRCLGGHRGGRPEDPRGGSRRTRTRLVPGDARGIHSVHHLGARLPARGGPALGAGAEEMVGRSPDPCAGVRRHRQPRHRRLGDRAPPNATGAASSSLAPYRESGYRLLMDALAHKGNTAEALLVYERLRGLLRDELGTSPSVMTQTLHRRLLQRLE